MKRTAKGKLAAYAIYNPEFGMTEAFKASAVVAWAIIGSLLIFTLFGLMLDISEGAKFDHAPMRPRFWLSPASSTVIVCSPHNLYTPSSLSPHMRRTSFLPHAYVFACVALTGGKSEGR